MRDYLTDMAAAGAIQIVETDENGDPVLDGEGDQKDQRLSVDELATVQKLIEGVAALDGQDTKFEQLQDALAGIFATGDVQKVLIFSFFKRTLRYLRKRLEDTYGVELIDGDVPPEERGERIERFRTDSRLQILLSSEVGGEGLDLQFSNCMVNYDLPWNPMRVEQRIGRIDRHGQESEKVRIFNFSVKDTIEANIFERALRADWHFQALDR